MPAHSRQTQHEEVVLDKNANNDVNREYNNVKLRVIIFVIALM